MDKTIITNWNAVVKPEDRVYHLGDFSYYNFRDTMELLFELNGTIMFVYGNHDKTMREIESYSNKNWGAEINKKIVFLGNMFETKVEEQDIVFNHYAMRVWNKSHYGAWHLYGHSHGSLPDDPTSHSIDVGVDVHGYRPISFDEVAIYMAKKNWLPIDHHGDRKAEGGKGLSKEEYARLERQRQYEMLKKEFGNGK
jgi:calcineurin-like phosphoesterase family protein